MSGRLKFHYGYVIVACCCLIMGIDVGLVMSCAGIFYQPVSQSIGVSVGKLGLFMSCSFLCSTLMLPLAGKLIERYSARWLFSINSGVLGLCLVVMGFFSSVWEFYIAGAVIGITLAPLLYLSFPTMVSRWFRSRVGFFMGVCSAASGIGGIIFNPIGASLIATYGWRMTYIIFGLIILLLVTPLLALFLRNYPQDKALEPCGALISSEDCGPRHKDTGITYSAAVRMPVFYGLIIFAFLIMSVSTLNPYIPNYAQGLNYTLQQASYAAAAVMAGVTIGKIILGILNDISGILGLAATVILGITGIIMLLVGESGIFTVIAGSFLFGWAYAGVTVQTPMLVREVFGNVDYPRIYSIISIALAAGGAITAGGWGILADYTSFSLTFTIAIGFLIICGLIGIWALKIIRKNKL